MKAWRLHGIGDIRFEEIEKPDIKENEVLVEVKAAGVCGSDIPRIYTTGAYSHPLVPGHEFAGIVVASGKDSDKSWVGKRVGVFPLIPCRECEPCRNKQYEMCRSYNYLGSRCDGGFAEYVAVPVTNLIEISDNVSYKEAAMLEPMAVAVHAMRRTLRDMKHNQGTQEEPSILIYGLGTIGLFLLMFLKEAGYNNIYAVGNKAFQREKAIEIGLKAENYIDCSEQDSKLFSNGFDICFECVGKSETMNKSVEFAKPAGKVCFVGNPHSDMIFDKKIYWKILRNQLTIVGTWNSSFTKEESDDWNYVVSRLEDKSINPEIMITHTYDMEQALQGLVCMRDKKEEYIKIMIDMG